MLEAKVRKIVEDPTNVSQLAPKEVQALLEEVEQAFEKGTETDIATGNRANYVCRRYSR